ncbi:MAG: hypothetical protein CMJ58_19310 [Planctomycetaceae bacterium]|nr:hypothetical protein [Planctomycetaceae bacterium]
MWQYAVKTAISAVLIVLVAEASKRSTLAGGLLASLPLVSYLGIIWLYVDERNTQQIADLSWSILWLVLPSLLFFVALPLLLKRWPFVPSMAAATAIMLAGYGAMTWALRRFGWS